MFDCDGKNGYEFKSLLSELYLPRLISTKKGSEKLSSDIKGNLLDDW